MFFLVAVAASAQVKIVGPLQLGDTTQTHIIFTKNGDRMVGRMLGYDESEVQFLMLGKKVNFQLKNVERLVVEGGKASPVMLTDLTESKRFAAPMQPLTRSFISPTGFLLPKGQSEYRNTEILVNNFDHGVSDHFNVGAMAITAIETNLIGTRASFGASLSQNLHFAATGQAHYIFGMYEDNGLVTTLNGTFTFGTLEEFVSLGIGRANDNYGSTYNLLTICASLRAGEKGRVFIEYNRAVDTNYFYVNTLANAGASVFKKGNRLDFGISLNIEDNEYFIPIPIIAYSKYF